MGDQALLNCCAVDHKVFRQLLKIFQPVFDGHTVDKKTGRIRKKKGPRGRPRELDAIGALGLVLYWYRTRGSCARSLVLPFGITSTCMYEWLKFSRRVLLSVLQHVPEAKVLPPTNAEVEEYANAISTKYDVLRPYKVWGAVDGLKLRLQQSGDYHLQNQFYNGWCSNTYINCVFVFAPDGRIRLCVINAPGTFHDSTIADYGIYERMEEIFDRSGGRIVVDSAFKMSQRDYLIRSAQTVNSSDEDIHRVNRAATSVRQLSEHGMRMIQGQFPRFKDNIRFDAHDSTDRRISLHLMVMLYNFQTTKIGINHMLNSFMSTTEGFESYAYTASGQRCRIIDSADDWSDVLATRFDTNSPSN